jgi:hypothetical protein
MGGKRLKFPARGKFVDTSKDNVVKEEEEKPISEEEHKKKMDLLKSLGLIK